MRMLMCAMAVLVVGCGGGAETPANRLVGNWIYLDSAGTSGLGATFRPDGTYTTVILGLTSTTTANVEVENGSYTATDTTFTATPREWTCPGPDPVVTLGYAFSGSSLVVKTSTGAVSLIQNTSPASSSFAFTYGCTTSGSFVPRPLAPVGN